MTLISSFVRLHINSGNMRHAAICSSSGGLVCSSEVPADEQLPYLYQTPGVCVYFTLHVNFWKPFHRAIIIFDDARPLQNTMKLKRLGEMRHGCRTVVTDRSLMNLVWDGVSGSSTVSAWDVTDLLTLQLDIFVRTSFYSRHGAAYCHK